MLKSAEWKHFSFACIFSIRDVLTGHVIFPDKCILSQCFPNCAWRGTPPWGGAELRQGRRQKKNKEKTEKKKLKIPIFFIKFQFQS
jgi:hypothetical protein